MSDYLRIHNLHKSYLNDDRERAVLNGVDLEVEQGEFISIIGPSGCGKSTLLQLIAGFIEPDGGNILKSGKPIKGADADRIMIFQSFEQLFPWKTVEGNICFVLKSRNIGGTKKDRREIAGDYLQKVDLEGFINYYPHQLSGGMKQRAVLARALAAEPEILLMDEPFGSLDSLTRQELQELLINVWQQNKMTVIFVTHDIREAIILSDRIAVMDKDRGGVQRIFRNQLSRPRKESKIEFMKLYNLIKREL